MRKAILVTVILSTTACNRGPGPAEDIVAAEALRDRACACETVECAGELNHELVVFNMETVEGERRARLERGTDAERRRFMDATSKGVACVSDKVQAALEAKRESEGWP